MSTMISSTALHITFLSLKLLTPKLTQCKTEITYGIFFSFFFFWPLSFYCETDVLISYQDYSALCKLITCLGTLNPNSFLELESSASHTLGVGGTKRKLEIVFTRAAPAFDNLFMGCVCVFNRVCSHDVTATILE